MYSSLLAPKLQQPPPPPEDIYDIVVLEPRESLLPALLWGAGVLLVLLILIGLLLWWLLKRKSSDPVLSARGKVNQKLRQLEIRENTMEPNRFAQELSDTLKDYLTEKYRDPVRYETAQEFLRRSSEPGASILPEAAAEELREFLTVSEEVKFGNSAHATSRTSLLLQRARSVVDLCDVISEDRATPKHEAI